MLVENVSYQINWKAFRKGTSIFIPCINPPSAKDEIMATMRRLKINVVTKVVIEDGVRGMRIWRL
jgi:hypothetical protein